MTGYLIGPLVGFSFGHSRLEFQAKKITEHFSQIKSFDLLRERKVECANDGMTE